ncbi:MAG: SDR family NAD(P)-dependent oxidoreductase [Solirubrobacteraceae bacterium]|nr:SDR family NAD(P)-dependent oxidoreductase [Solirubrobacteraceae bacterium]
MAREFYDPRGKVVFITGAARGIGLAAAKRLAARGAKLALVGLEPELLAKEAAALGPDAVWFHADVTDRDALRDAVQGTIDRFGGIDVAIANAGISPVGTVRTLPDEAFERTIAVNLVGVWNTLRATADAVIARQGYLLTIASLSAPGPAPMMGPYTASKAAVENLTRAFQMEIAHTGTKAGVAYFGFIDTDLVRDGFAHSATQRMQANQPGALFKPVPVSHAAKAIEKGVASRAQTVVAPRWVRAFLLARGLFPLTFARTGGDPAVAEAVALADAEPWAPKEPADANSTLTSV